jgi:hypothetical protein
MDKQLFMVELGNVHFICYAHGREDAKRQAHSWIGADKENYIVTPLTEPGDRIHLAITVFA